MDFDELVGRLKIAGVACLLVGGLFYWQIRRANNAAVREMVESRETLPSAPEQRFSRLAKVEAAERAGSVDEALAQCRQILSAAQDAAEKDEAAKVMARLLRAVFRQVSQKGDLDAAEPLWKEIVAMSAEGTRDIASWDLRSWAGREIGAGNLAAGRRLVAMDLLRPSSRDDIPGLDLLRAWRTLLLKERAAALAGGKNAEAESFFLEAAALSPWEEELARSLASAPLAELMATGRRLLDAKKHGAALAYFNAAWNVPGGWTEGREAIPELRGQCWWGLAQEAEAAGNLDAILLNSAVSFLERVEGERAAEAQARMAAIIEKQADKAAAAKEFSRADSLLSQASGKAEEAWRRRAFGRPPDLWTGVDTEVALRLQKGFAAGIPQSNELSRLVMNDKDAASPLLECKRLAAKREGLGLDWAVNELPRNLENGLRMLRAVLRVRTDAMAKAQADLAVRNALKAAVAKRDLSQMVDLAAFQLSELGAPPKGDPFRQTILSGLEAAAKELEEKSPNRRVFILTLLAEGFPDEPAGHAAQEQAVAQGLKLVQGLGESSAGGQPRGASGLPGLSVVSIENSTEHHILIFYDGPERFFLRLNPYRRGSAVLRDGSYAMGVMASADEIVPYRAKPGYAGQRTAYRFIIERRAYGGSASTNNRWSAPASGDWTVLRSPPGLPRLAADPATGKVQPSQP